MMIGHSLKALHKVEVDKWMCKCICGFKGTNINSSEMAQSIFQKHLDLELSAEMASNYENRTT